MLSLFPSLLTFQQFAPVLLRLTLGVIFLFWSYRKFKEKEKGWSLTLAFLEGVLGVLFVVGFLTQLAALVATITFLVHILRKIKDKAFLTNGINYYFILLIISLCLLLTGPGFFAFDLPL